MSQRFFDLSDDVYVPHRWHLDTPIDSQGRKVQDWDFKRGTQGQPDQYIVLVATRLIRCIDEKASEVSFWTPEHGVPDKVGHYMGVDRMRIDKVKVGNAMVFRPEGWEVALIVSEEIKDALERMGTTGTRFEEV
jgi:hypothetical protein